MEKLATLIPDFNILVDVFNDMKAKHNEDMADIEDSKKTSLLILLGVLYKYQKRIRSRELESLSSAQEDLSKEIVAVCARYWSQINSIGHCIRQGVRSATPDTLMQVCQDNREELARVLDIQLEDVVMTWVSEMQCMESANDTDQDNPDEAPSISGHCPDFTITLDRNQSAVVITLLGTRMFPSPKVQDIVMDLRAERTSFLDGEAHEGMAIGANNILDKTFDVIRETIENNPDYSIIVAGYSLGAGLAQLFTAQLLANDQYRSQLPPDVDIKALCYGSPPVFRSCDDSGEQKVFPEIIIIQNDKDGIIGASSKTVVDVFNKTVAIDAADIHHDIMVKMILERVQDDEEEDLVVDEPSESSWSWQDLKDSISRSLSFEVDPREWAKVEEALENLKSDTSTNLHLLGHTVLQMKNEGGEVKIRKFEGLDCTSALSREIRLSKKMFDHHMPWGYSGLFTLSDTETLPDLSVLNYITNKDTVEMSSDSRNKIELKGIFCPT